MKLEGRGSVEQLEKEKPKGKCRKWRLWIRAGGKNRSRRFTGTYREAQAALDAFKEEVGGLVPDAESFRAYAEAWYAYRRDSGAAEANTLAKNRYNLNALERVLGDAALGDLTPETCRDALLRIRNGENASGRVLAGATMVGTSAVLKMILQQAEDDGRIARNPMRKVRMQKRDTQERRTLTPQEVEGLLDRLDEMPCDGRVMAVYLIACLGLRRAEACALFDEDFGDDGLVHVRRAVKEADGTIGRPKSAAGARTLPAPRRLVEKVARWREQRERMGLADAPTLACNARGGVLLPQNLYRWWHGNAKRKGVRGELGCEGIDLHELRHSNLTMMARHLSPFDLQRYAGWSSLDPARIYVHENLGSVVAGVDEAWGGTA